MTLNGNASALEHRQAALALLHEAAASDTQRRGGSLNRYVSQLNATFAYVLDTNRVTDHDLFKADKRISAPLDKRVPNATDHLLTSDAKLARQAIADAERTKRGLEARNVSFDEANVSEEIALAKDARDRGARLGMSHPLGAMEQYRMAWVHAQRALDLMDWAATPTVTITTREDMPHEGNVTYTLEGTVFDVRPYEVETVTVTHDGINRSVSLYSNTTPATNGTFAVNLTLHDSINEIPVAATDPNEALAPHDERSLPSPATGVDVLRLDADGLPDVFEKAHTGTAPLGPDSNSTLTPINESGNDVIDGAEDLDNDTVNNYFEYVYGLNPHSPDTDGDNLTDSFELRFPGIDPVNPDTDNDSVLDDAENLDGDGLSNRQEQAAGTNPRRTDTDGDSLSDAAEVEVHGTDPRRPDTDGDGLTDPDELELGTDPTVADTDGDGVPDGEETFETAATNESVGAAFTVNATGNAAKQVTIRNDTSRVLNTDSVRNVSASGLVEITSRSDFSSASVELSYDQSAVADASDVAVFRYDPKRQTFVKQESTVDAANRTVSATVFQTGTFAAFSESAWADRFEDPLPSKWSRDVDLTDDEWTCEGENDPECEDAGDGITVGAGTSATESTATATAEVSGSGGISINAICAGPGNCIPVDQADDDDGDGTIDYWDDCPNTPGAGSDGCPVDSDGDGVNDLDDDCPNTAGSGSDGCPISPPDDDDEADDPNEPIDEGQTVTSSTYGRSLTFRDAQEIHVDAVVSGSAEEAGLRPGSSSSTRTSTWSSSSASREQASPEPSRIPRASRGTCPSTPATWSRSD
ncbi:hypothetical protein ACFQH6_18735 [Halobacteriaceae archaeon GCM10025711]